MDTLSPSDKNKMRAARELLRENRYREAKSLLQGINHPKAYEWRQKIDRILASEPTQIMHPVSPTIQQYSSRKPIPPPPPLPLDSSVQPYNQYAIPQSHPHKKRPKNHFLRNSIIAILVFFLCIVFLGVFTINFYQTTPSNRHRDVQQPTADISARMLAIEPDSIKITDPNNTEIPQSFLNNVRNSIAPFGYVEEYTGVINNERRLLADVIVQLDETRTPYYPTARNVMETVYRLYAHDIDPQTAGEITVFVEWEKDGLFCGLSSGMGYLAIQRISWNQVDQAGIFRAIDKEIYEDGIGRGDRFSGKPYSEVAWAPHPNAITACYN